MTENPRELIPTQPRSTRKRGARRGDTPKSAHRVWPWVLLGVLVVVVGALIWGSVRYGRIADQLEPEEPGDREAVAAVVDPVEPTEVPEPLYILVLGADARPGENRSRSDTIILVRVDLEAKTVSMLSIPRDSRVPVEGHGLDKINHAHAYGGPALAIKTVQDYTGLPVNHYVDINFEGFAAVVDAVGGVTVDGERMGSAEALAFVRSRQYADGDFTRVKNQQKFLAAFAKEAVKPQNFTRLPSIADEVAGNITTDMSIPQLLQLAMDMKDIEEADVTGYTVPGTTAMIGGISYVIPAAEQADALFRAFANGVAGEQQ